MQREGGQNNGNISKSLISPEKDNILCQLILL